MAVYFATKAYVLFFTEALSSEFKQYGINATALYPVPTKTNFISVAKGCGESRAFQKLLSPKKVAAVGYRRLMKEKSVKVIGFKNKTSYRRGINPLDSLFTVTCGDRYINLSNLLIINSYIYFITFFCFFLVSELKTIS